MFRFTRTVFPSLLFILLFSCDNSPGLTLGSGSDRGIIIPSAGKGITLFQGNMVQRQESDEATPVPKIAVPDNFLVQQVFEMNFDTDSSMEQCLVYKLRDDQSNRIFLSIVDFDEGRNFYYQTWQGETRASNTQTFSLRLLDLTSDGIPEIVCTGTDTQGLQTMDVFLLQEGSGDRAVVQYKNVLSLSADLSVEITRNSNDREVDFSEIGPVSQSSLPMEIVSQSKDADSTNILDIIENRYTWRANLTQYALASSRKIPGAVLQEAQLAGLFRGGIEDLEKFLSGAWFRTFTNRKKQEINQIIFFDQESRSVRLIEGDRMESHTWNNTTKPSYGGRIQVYLINESFHTLRSTAMIVPNNLNNLSFSLQDKDDWTGTYQRLTGDLEEKLLSGTKKSLSLDKIVLSGLYRSENGLEIVFTSPRFVWRQGELNRQGAFLSYQLNDTVLEMQFISDKGLVEEKRYYLAKLTETQENDRTLRELVLQPAVVAISGAYASTNEILKFEQNSSDIIE